MIERNLQGGAGGLKPEKSKQWTIGFRVDPIQSVSFGADLWQVKLRDAIATRCRGMRRCQP